MAIRRFSYAKLGRAGLGNELFPYLRSLDFAEIDGARLVPPRWFKLRIGPWLRQERDRRRYWLLFRRPRLADRFLQVALDLYTLVTKISGSRLVLKALEVENSTGMGQFFADLRQEPGRYLAFLEQGARKGSLSAKPDRPYLCLHVRLGDFARLPAGPVMHTRDNVSTPVEWFATTLEAVRRRFSDIDVYIASDGSDEELSPILSQAGVSRTSATNALDEMLWLAGAKGIIGSRSTFTAWGAFLGEAPLLLAPGGNAYHPHASVWEAHEDADIQAWIAAVELRIKDAKLGVR
jgi:hypothetical protein